MVILAECAVLACYIYDPSMAFLMYSGLPVTLQNPVTFCICMVEEARYLLICAGIGIPAWQMQVIEFDLVNYNMEEIIERLISYE